MVYVTVMQSPVYHQMSLEEFLFGGSNIKTLVNPNTTNTRTYEFDYLSDKFSSRVDPVYLTQKLQRFNESVKALKEVPRRELYHSFSIPKKSGGLRKIDAPQPELMNALRTLKVIFEEDFHALYHTSAFAYIKHRNTVDAIKRHQDNESKWFGKFDLSNFFGSITLDYAMKMISMVFPFSEIVVHPAGKKALEDALELAFLDGGLPQGTPISPLITNIIMIPIDYKLANGFRDLNHQRFVYTRYADDFIVSSKYTFKVNEVEEFIVKTLREFRAPFSLNSKKTRYGSSNGSNWNLGVMLNKDNNITVGHKKKKQLQAILTSFILDTQNGISWDLQDIQTMEGYRNYYRMVEGDTIDKIVKHVGDKFGVNVVKMIKDALRA